MSSRSTSYLPNGTSESRTVTYLRSPPHDSDGTVTKLVDGRAQARRTGERLTQIAGEQSLLFDGLNFKITGPDFGFSSFSVVAMPPGRSSSAGAGCSQPFAGFPTPGGANRWCSVDAGGPADWTVLRHGGGTGDYVSFLSRSIFSRWQQRRTSVGSVTRDGALTHRIDGLPSLPGRRCRSTAVRDVVHGVATPNDPSDDVKLTPRTILG